jgi:hypothetical protein
MLPSSKKPSSAPPREQAPDLSITADDHVHLHAAGYNESAERGLIHSFARFRSSPLDFIREVSLHVSGTEWRSYDNIIGQPIFYSGFSEQMKSRVLSSPMLVAKVRELAARRVDVEVRQGLLGNAKTAGEGDSKEKRQVQIEGSLMEVAETLTDNMICKMESKSFIRGAYYLATQLLTRAYHQGRLHPYPWRLYGESEEMPGARDIVRFNHGLIMGLQAYTSQAKKSSACVQLQRKRPRRSNQLYSSHVIGRMWTMCVHFTPCCRFLLIVFSGQSANHLL